MKLLDRAIPTTIDGWMETLKLMSLSYSLQEKSMQEDLITKLTARLDKLDTTRTVPAAPPTPYMSTTFPSAAMVPYHPSPSFYQPQVNRDPAFDQRSNPHLAAYYAAFSTMYPNGPGSVVPQHAPGYGLSTPVFNLTSAERAELHADKTNLELKIKDLSGKLDAIMQSQAKAASRQSTDNSEQQRSSFYQRTENGQPICRFCKKPGHVIANCPDPQCKKSQRNGPQPAYPYPTPYGYLPPGPPPALALAPPQPRSAPPQQSSPAYYLTPPSSATYYATQQPETPTWRSGDGGPTN